MSPAELQADLSRQDGSITKLLTPTCCLTWMPSEPSFTVAVNMGICYGWRKAKTPRLSRTVAFALIDLVETRRRDI